VRHRTDLRVVKPRIPGDPGVSCPERAHRPVPLPQLLKYFGKADDDELKEHHQALAAEARAEKAKKAAESMDDEMENYFKQAEEAPEGAAGAAEEAA